MASYALLSPASGAGKTTVAVALSQALLKVGKSASLSRSGEDGNAAADSALLGSLASSAGEMALTEAPGGDAGAAPEARAIVVVDAGKDAAEATTFCASVGERLAGVILNRVPSRRSSAFVTEMVAAGISVLFSLTEDRLLATPTLARVSEALSARPVWFDSKADLPMDRLAIAPISADPGQGYFSRTEANTVIVRSDKPDLQLAALNAGASCLIVTGGLPLLGYVLERAEADEIPLIATSMDTIATVKVVEELYGAPPFSGGKAAVARLAELTEGIESAVLSGG
jgi:BioD-like phosphotransacetylase family protein